MCAAAVLKPASRLWAATPAELFNAATTGEAIALTDDLDLAACELTGAPDDWTVPPYVYGSELCATTKLTRCRQGLGCAANKNMAGRCDAYDLAALPRAAMAMYVKTSGTRNEPKCEFVKVLSDGKAPAETAVVYDADGMIYWSLGMAGKVRVDEDSSLVFHWMFTHAGNAMLTKLLEEKCGAGGIACRAQARAVLAQGYHGLDPGATASPASSPVSTPLADANADADAQPLCDTERVRTASIRDVRRMYGQLREVLRSRADNPLLGKSRAPPALPYVDRATGWMYWLAEIHLQNALPRETQERTEAEVRQAFLVLVQVLVGDGEEKVRTFLGRVLKDVEGSGATIIRVSSEEAAEIHSAYQDFCEELRMDNQLPQRKYTSVGATHERIMSRLSEVAQQVPAVIGGGGRWPLRFCRSWGESRKKEDERLNGVSQHIASSPDCGGGDRTGATINLDFLTRGPGDHSMLAMYESGVLTPDAVPNAVVIRLHSPPPTLVHICSSSQSHPRQQEELASIVGQLLEGKVKRQSGADWPRDDIVQMIGHVRYWCAPDLSAPPDYLDGTCAVLTVMFGACAHGYPDCEATHADGEPRRLGRPVDWDPHDVNTAATEPMMATVANSAEGRLVAQILSIDRGLLDVCDVSHLGGYWYIDGTAVYKKTTEGKSPNSILFIMGSTNVDYLWHSRRFMRVVGQYGGKESRAAIACHTGFLRNDNWNLFTQLEEISNLPLFDGNTALIRSLKWLADSKCAEQNQCRSSSISDEPIVAVKITQEQLHVDGASSLDLAGDHLSDLYARGGRDAAWMMEFARLTVSASSAIRNSRSVQYARTYLPEVEARLNVSSGLFKRRLFTHRPTVVDTADWMKKLEQMELFPTTDDQLWYVVSTDEDVERLGFAKSSKGRAQLQQVLELAASPDHWMLTQGGDLQLSMQATLLVLSGAHLALDSNALLAVAAPTDPSLQTIDLSVSARMAIGEAIDSVCGPVVAYSGNVCPTEEQERRRCEGHVADALSFSFDRVGTEDVTSEATVVYARTILRQTIAATTTYSVSELVEIKCRLTKYSSNDCVNVLGSSTRKAALQHFQTRCKDYDSSVARELRARSCTAIEGCVYTPYVPGPPRVNQKCAGDADHAVSRAGMQAAARDLHFILSRPTLKEDAWSVATFWSKVLSSTATTFTAPEERFEEAVQKVAAAIDKYEDAMAEHNSYQDKLQVVKNFESDIKVFSDDDLQELGQLDGYSRCGVPWMSEFAWDPREYEDPDELHAALRCITGNLLDKMCRVLTEVGTGSLGRFEKVCLRISNIEFSSRNQYDQARQAYGDDLEAFLYGRLKGSKADRGTANADVDQQQNGEAGEQDSEAEEEDPESGLNPCAYKQVPAPYQEPYLAMCTLHTYLYLLFRSGKPEEEFAADFQTLVHSMDQTLEKLKELLWGMYPVIELCTGAGDTFPYSWMKRGCYYFYVMLPHVFRMRGRVGNLSARAGESAQYDGVAALHECTPIKGSNPTGYMECGVTKHFGRSYRWWAADEQRDAKRRAHRKFVREAGWARWVLAALPAALDVRWPEDLVSAFHRTGGVAGGGGDGERDESEDGSEIVDTDDLRDDAQGVSSLSQDAEPPADPAEWGAGEF